MNYADVFSPDYETAKTRFVDFSNHLITDRQSFHIPLAQSADESLSIDVMHLGHNPEKLLVLSSGLHGVEGYLGSAIQLAWLKALQESEVSLQGCSVLLIHAINPYGFKYLRRVDEHNVDLNRNFLSADNPVGENKVYSSFHRLLNPYARQGQGVFNLKAGWSIARYGLDHLKSAITKGQYEYPDGLFYGGNTRAQSTRIIQDQYQDWVSPWSRIFHIDFHSGLGNYADCKLLAEEQPRSDKFNLYKKNFDAATVQSVFSKHGVAYAANATMSAWLTGQNKSQYSHLAAEFGTYSNLRVLRALVNENAAHKYLDKESKGFKAAKAELLECFCPQDSVWRTKVIKRSLVIIEQALAALNSA